MAGHLRRRIVPFLALLGLLGLIPGVAGAVGHAAPAGSGERTVFLIVLENHSWSQIKGNTRDAPYINRVLLPQAAHAEQAFSPPGNHPSETNYLWLEGGTNFGVHTDDDPGVNHQSTSAHLVALLTKAGISWRSYQEDISGTDCPLTKRSHYVPRHNPMVYFDDVTGGTSRASATCIAHVRPFSELASDLSRSTVARYNFITPNLCHDMHGLLLATPSCLVANRHGLIHAGDSWLAHAVPPILSSAAYKQGGVLLITWDEGSCPLLQKIEREAQCGDGPIGLLVLSPAAKPGYANAIHYTHSSTLRTVQELFGVTPLLGDAKNATDLRDLFTQFP